MKVKQRISVICSLTLAVLSLPALSQNGPKARSSGETHERPPTNVKPSDPLWKRYQALGEQAISKGDKAMAKHYYLQALAQIEKTAKVANDPQVHYMRLEGDLLKLYPHYPKDHPPGEGEAQIKFDEEELAVLTRIHRLNQNNGAAKSLPAQALDEQIHYVEDDLNKNKAAQESADKKLE